MRASKGFDRMSTSEELHQVLAVLDEFAGGTWTVPEDNQAEAHATTLWADTPVKDSVDMESLAEFFMNRAELKN